MRKNQNVHELICLFICYIHAVKHSQFQVIFIIILLYNLKNYSISLSKV